MPVDGGGLRPRVPKYDPRDCGIVRGLYRRHYVFPLVKASRGPLRTLKRLILRQPYCVRGPPFVDVTIFIPTANGGAPEWMDADRVRPGVERLLGHEDVEPVVTPDGWRFLEGT